MITLIQPKEIEILGKTYIISKFDCISGRKIISQYLTTGLPKIGDYELNEKYMLELMSFVGVPRDGGQPLMLTTRDLIKNHVVGEDPWEVLMKIEAAMLEYNSSFFRNGRALIFLGGIAQKLPQWILKMLTDLSEQLSQTVKPPSTN